MPFRLAPFAPVLLGVASAQVALGIMSPLIPLILLQAGVSAPTIGLVASAYFVGFLAGARTAERIVRAVGHIRAFAVFAALAADASLLMAYTTHPTLTAALRAVIGYSASGLLLVAESWLHERAEQTSRGRIFGAYLVVSWGGAAAGPMLLNVVQASSLAFIMVGLAFASSLIPMGLTQQPNPEIRRHAPLGLSGLYRISPVGVVLCVTSGLVNSSFYALVPVYLQRTGYGAAVVTRFLAVALLAGLVVQYPVGMLSDRLGRRRVTVALLLIAFGLAVALNMAGGVAAPLLAAIGCAFAGMTAPLYGLGSGQTNDRLRDGNFVAASGGLLFAWSLGSTVGPSLAGAVMGSVGPSGLFTYTAIVLGLVTLFTGARMLLRDEVPRELRTAFVPAAAAPPRLIELAVGEPSPHESAVLAETPNPQT